MGQVTVNNIIDGICTAINNEFGDEYEIYTELVEQGLKQPCFTVACISSSMSQRLGRRYKRSNLFCIYYFPSDGTEKRLPSQDVKERLYNALEYITVDNDLTHGTKMEGTIVDNVLSFMVNYDMEVLKVYDDNDNNMELIDITINTK